jgi:hypothetical protein
MGDRKPVSAEVLLKELSRRGVSLAADGERLTYKAPLGALTDELREAIIILKPELLGLLHRSTATQPEAKDDYSRMTLSEFARSRRMLRIRSRVLGEDVWWVSDESLRLTVPDPTLVVYTAAELRHLVDISPRDLINLHRIKKTFHGHIEN